MNIQDALLLLMFLLIGWFLREMKIQKIKKAKEQLSKRLKKPRLFYLRPRVPADDIKEQAQKEAAMLAKGMQGKKK